MGVKLLHFADAHIDIAGSGKRDPQSGLPLRVIDFLTALDKIVDTAIDEKVDLVLFAGDAYRDAAPVPTYQREWGKRMMRLSAAQIPVLMIPGNHDTSAASGKASALQEYDTLNVPYLHLARAVELWTPERLDGAPVQVLTVPWIPISRMIARNQTMGQQSENAANDLEFEISREVSRVLEQADPALPLILLAHYSVVGAQFANQQMVTLGREVVLPLGLLTDPRIAYTALGHIHKFQDLNEGKQPPVIYPGSIERVNFGETVEDKGCVIVEIDGGQTRYHFHELAGRRFFNREVTIQNADTFQEEVLRALPDEDQIPDAMIRIQVSFPREWGTFLDERELRKRTEKALAFHLVLKPTSTPRIRLPEDIAVSSLTHLDLLERYFESIQMDKNQPVEPLKEIASSIFLEERMGENTDLLDEGS